MTQVSPDSGSLRPGVQALVLALLCAGVFFLHLDTGDVGLMEARNFVAAREISESGSWLVPTMNGEIRIAKPPFPTWMAALARTAAGSVDSVAAMRAPSGLVAVLMVFALFGICRELFGAREEAFWASSILATSIQVVQIGRQGFWDIFSQALAVLGVWATVLALRRERFAGWTLLAGVFYGLCALSKGPASFYTVVLPFGAAYMAAFGISGIRRSWGRLAFIVMLAAILGGTWFVYLFNAHPDAARTIFAAEAEARMKGHQGPPWFYLNFPLFAGVWILPLLAGMVVVFVRRQRPWPREDLFSMVWLVLTVALLSIPPEKKERYLLPASLPMALVAARMFGRIREGLLSPEKKRRMEARVLSAHVVLMVLVLALLPVALLYFLPAAVRQAETARLVALALSFSALALALLLFRLRGNIRGIVLSTAAIVWVACTVGLPLIKPFLIANPEYRRLYEVRSLPDLAGVPLYEMQDSDSSFMEMVWDAGRTVKRIRKLDGIDPARDLPIAVLSDGPIDGRVPGNWRGRVRIALVGVFDYNQRKPGNKTYLTLFRQAAD